MPDFLLSILIGLSLCYAAGRRIRPLPLKIALIAVLTVLTLLSCLDVPAARYPLITAGMLLIAAACWNGRKQPERVPALLLFVVLFGLLPVGDIPPLLPVGVLLDVLDPRLRRQDLVQHPDEDVLVVPVREHGLESHVAPQVDERSELLSLFIEIHSSNFK